MKILLIKHLTTMIKLVVVYLTAELVAIGVYLQALNKRITISDGLLIAIVNVVGLIVVAWFNNRKLNKAITVVDALKVQTDGKMNELLEVNKEVSRRIGMDEGKAASQAEHVAQSEKDKDANIAIGKVAGLEEAKQANISPPKEP